LSGARRRKIYHPPIAPPILSLIGLPLAQSSSIIYKWIPSCVDMVLELAVDQHERVCLPHPRGPCARTHQYSTRMFLLRTSLALFTVLNATACLSLGLGFIGLYCF
jgi:hypothetical protein